jgi:hypothetical protein
MAKLSQLTEGFMQAFLRNNPKSLVDSNGYLRSEYEEELARRAQPVTEQPTGVPDPRTWRPQFECTGEVAPPAFESPDAQLEFNVVEKPSPWIVPTEDAGLPAGGNFLNLSDQPIPPEVPPAARNDEAPVIEDCAVRPVEPVEYVDTTAYELYTQLATFSPKDVNPAPEPETQASNLTTEAPPDVITVAEPSDSEQ